MFLKFFKDRHDFQTPKFPQRYDTLKKLQMRVYPFSLFLSLSLSDSTLFFFILFFISFFLTIPKPRRIFIHGECREEGKKTKRHPSSSVDRRHDGRCLPSWSFQRGEREKRSYIIQYWCWCARLKLFFFSYFLFTRIPPSLLLCCSLGFCTLYLFPFLENFHFKYNCKLWDFCYYTDRQYNFRIN